MGFKRKVCQPLQVIAVCVEQAVDWASSKCGKLEYIEQRNFEDLVFVEGEDPTTFTIHPLPPGILARCDTRLFPENLLYAFRYGVRSCSDNTLGLKWDTQGEYPVVETDSMEGLPANVWREIGSLVIQRESLTEGEKPRFALPRG
jgi:hypothetical protein